MEEFRERLEAAMKLRRMTGAELSRRTGISKSHITRYLRGDYKPRQPRIDDISNALRVDPAWLMGYDVEMELKPTGLSERLEAYAEAMSEYMISEKEAKLINEYRRADRKTRAMVNFILTGEDDAE